MRLKEILSNSQTVIFLGAGASADCGLPLGDQASTFLIRQLFRRINHEELWNELNLEVESFPWPRFEVLLDVLSQYIPKSPLDILGTFRNVGISQTHLLLATLFKSPTLWLTTNFDNQIELALERSNQRFTVASSRDEVPRILETNGSHHIIKLHGDDSVADPERDLGATIEQILRRLPESTLKAILRHTGQRPSLFVGYAARDPDLVDLIQSIIRQAPGVAWIGLSEPSNRVRLLLDQHLNASYYSGGAMKVIGSEIESLNIPEGNHDQKTWENAVARWSSSLDCDNTIQAIATLCLDRSDKRSREIIISLHREISNTDPVHQLWTCERLIEVNLRSLDKDVEDVEESVRRLGDIISNHGNLNSIRTLALLALADTHFRSDNVVTAYDRALQAYQAAHADGEIDLELQAMAKLGIYAFYSGTAKSAEGLEWLEKALEQARIYQKPIYEVEIVRSLATAKMRNDEAAEAEALLKSIEPQLLEIGNPRQIMIWKQNLAEAYRIQRKFSEAIQLNESLINQATLIDDTEMLMNASGNLGLCYVCTAAVKMANMSFNRSMNYGSKIRGEAIYNACYNLGWMRILLGQWENAIPFLDRAAEGYLSFGSNERLGGALALKGFCLFRLGNRQQARLVLERIYREALLPAGLFQHDLRMLSFVLDSGFEILDMQLIDRISSEFQGAYEQQYYLLMCYLETFGPPLESLDRMEIIRCAMDVAKKSGLSLYFSVLENYVEVHQDLIDPHLLMQIHSASPGKLSDFIDELVTNNRSNID